MTLNELAERAGTTRPTLARLERGDLSGSVGLLARILGVLGLEADIDSIASDDKLGQRVQDVHLRRPRTSRGKSAGV